MPIHRPSEKTKTKKPKSSILFRRIKKKLPLWERNPILARKISHMRLAIAPIVHVRTGIAPKEYPANMLSLFLLTERQLDNMAEYYSQIEESVLTNQYPHRMAWDKPFLCNAPELPEDCRLSDLERLKVKQRMFARFIGMRGAETPGWEYERQVEILRNKIRHSILEEENSLRKTFQGPRGRL